MNKCVCNTKKHKVCRYHATYPNGRPYEPLLPTPFLRLLQEWDERDKLIIEES